MSELVKRVNRFFTTANRDEIEAVLGKLILSDRQSQIVEMFYLRKLNIDYIADTLGFCSNVVDRDLLIIRKKLDPVIP